MYFSEFEFAQKIHIRTNYLITIRRIHIRCACKNSNWFQDCNTFNVELSLIFSTGETSLLIKRFRHNIDPTRPKMPTWKRKVMLEFAKPVFSIQHPTTEFQWQDCPRREEDLKIAKVQCSV